MKPVLLARNGNWMLLGMGDNPKPLLVKYASHLADEVEREHTARPQTVRHVRFMVPIFEPLRVADFPFPSTTECEFRLVELQMWGSDVPPDEAREWLWDWPRNRKRALIRTTCAYDGDAGWFARA